ARPRPPLRAVDPRTNTRGAGSVRRGSVQSDLAGELPGERPLGIGEGERVIDRDDPQWLRGRARRGEPTCAARGHELARPDRRERGEGRVERNEFDLAGQAE